MKLEDILAFQNPWWRTGNVGNEKEKLGYFERPMLNRVFSQVSAGGKVVSIIGPRQVGKTVLVHQAIQRLLKEGVAPNRIFYLPLDNPEITKSGVVNELMDFVAQAVKTPLYELETPVYVFLDEVHKLRSWGEEVKHWHDLKLKIRFTVTGSSAARILTGAGESLLGRVSHNMMFSLSFNEFLRVKYGIDVAPSGVEQLKKTHSSLVKDKQKIRIAFADYMLRGGYPALLNEETSGVFQTLLEYKDLSLQRDIFDVEEVRDSKTINELISILAESVGSKVSYNKLGTLLLSRVNTVKRYLSMLESIYFVKEMSTFRNKKYSSAKYGKKVIFLDNGMMNSLNTDYEMKKMPQAVENAVCSAVYRKMTDFEMNPELQFWSNGNGEVDCILRDGAKTVLPIEVKFRETVSDDDMKGLVGFMDKLGTDAGLLVSKDTFEERNISGKRLILVPAWLFLLAFG